VDKIYLSNWFRVGLMRSWVAVLLALMLLLSSLPSAYAIGDEERDEDKVPLTDWTLHIDGTECNLTGTPMLLHRSAIFLPARRTAACAGFEYKTYPRWFPRLGGVMIIARNLNAWRPLGNFQRLSLSAYPEDPSRSTVQHSFDGHLAVIEHGGLHAFEWSGINYIWSRGLTDALGAQIRADFSEKVVSIDTRVSPTVQSKPSWADWSAFDPWALDGRMTYNISAAAVRNMYDYYDMTRGRGLYDNALRKLDHAGTPYIEDPQNARLRVLAPGTNTVAADLYANGSGERYAIVWMHDKAQAAEWLGILTKARDGELRGVKWTGVGVSASAALLATMKEDLQTAAQIAPFLGVVVATAAVASELISEDYRLDIEAASACIDSASGPSVGIVLKRYWDHDVIGCIAAGYTDTPLNSAGTY